MYRLWVILLLFLGSNSSPAQHLAAYSDSRGHFFVFDHEEQLMIEELAVRSFEVGGNCILYVDATGHLKCYYNNWVKQLELGGISEYRATDYLAAYLAYGKLCLVAEGSKKILSYRCPMARIEDSLIVFYDKNQEALQAFYNDTIQEIENGIIGFPATSMASSDNLFAYVSARTGNFNIFYRGKITTLIRSAGNLRYATGRDIVVYINPENGSFNVFYKGQIRQLETFPPQSFKVGDGFVAYVDDMGAFNVFDGEQTRELSYYTPDSYQTEDQLLVYATDNYFYAYWETQSYELESFIPLDYKMDWNTLVYRDQTNRIWSFSKGQKDYLVNDLLDNYTIYRDLIILDPHMERCRIYYQGKTLRGFAY